MRGALAVLVGAAVVSACGTSEPVQTGKKKPEKQGVHVGDQAPDFALPTHSSKAIRLSDLRGKKAVVLYFYPKDDTPGCTKEACGFRDNYAVLAKADVEVIGVSADSLDSHAKFAQKYSLPFPLVSDADGSLRKQYGVGGESGRPARTTFVIDKGGVVRQVLSGIAATAHVEKSLEALNVAK
jgi:peroxiredoxin Q/BCP